KGRNSPDHYLVRAAIRKNNGDWIFSPAYPLTGGAQAFEIRWQASTSVIEPPNGVLQFWLDGVLKYSQTSVDNHTHRVDYVRMGVVETPDVHTAGSHCLDHFESRRSTYIGLADPWIGFVCFDNMGGEGEEQSSSDFEDHPDESIPQQPVILSGEPIFADGFESGDLSAWDWYADDPFLAAATHAALIGEYGLSVRIDTGFDDDPRSVVVRDETPDGETIYQARFYLDPNSLNLNGGNHTILRGEMAEGVGVLALDLGSQPEMEDYQLFVSARLVDEEGLPGDWLFTPSFTIGDGPAAIEIGWGAASEEQAEDGWLRFWLDGETVFEHTQLRNYGLALEQIELGSVHSPLPGASGVYCLDEFASTRGGYIGLGDAPVSCGEEAPEANGSGIQWISWLPKLDFSGWQLVFVERLNELRMWVSTNLLRPVGAWVSGLPAASNAWLFSSGQPALAAPVGDEHMSPLTESGVVITNIIDYTYDGLSRVIEAVYNDVTSFTYDYDGAGNLLSFSRWNGIEVETVNFVYNGANQIECLDGDGNGLCGDPEDIPYTYDRYGNLTSDGVKTYSYDAANRLTSVNEGGIVTTYAYSGDGDRVSQTVDGVTTTYVIDVAAPLTMVLAETTGTETIYYLHGLNLIGQSDGVLMEYFTYDGLGSVRQVVDGSGELLYGQGFDPYGNPYLDAGDEKPNWGFTGEQTDENGLIFLRARYYQPGQGRFLTMDPWKGDQQRPMSLNPWVYTYGNPINFVDPTGTSPIDAILKKLRDDAEACYNAGDLQCVWFKYYTLAVGGQVLGYTNASRHMFQFLEKKGDIIYEPYGYMSFNKYDSSWVQMSQAAQNFQPTLEQEFLTIVSSKAKQDEFEGIFETNPISVLVDSNKEPDLYYAMNTFSLWAEGDYKITGCYHVLIKPTFRFEDPYDWHIGLTAQGPQAGLAGFKDEWAAALHDAGLAQEFLVSGYWYGTTTLYIFSSDWLNQDVSPPPISIKPVPLYR
ncbi:MAG: hypothetical protein IBX69_17025, partial [Anaerolineales bacterium]|nr:hypothetical protein [Anaerolineales bacterium]